MKRLNLITMLHSYQPTDEGELFHKRKMIKFIEDYPNCFDRSLSIGHITSSAWLLNNDCSKALLMHHAKLGMWVQLGGHCDGNPDVLAVAIKEAQEESGIEHIIPISQHIFDIDIHFIPANPKEQAHYHYDVRFLLQVTSNEQVIKNNESKELRWISKNPALLPTQEPSVIRMFNKWANNS